MRYLDQKGNLESDCSEECNLINTVTYRPCSVLRLSKTKTLICNIIFYINDAWLVPLQKHAKQAGHCVYSETWSGASKAFICSQINKWKDANDFPIRFRSCKWGSRMDGFWFCPCHRSHGCMCGLLPCDIYVYHFAVSCGCVSGSTVKQFSSQLIGLFCEGACQKSKCITLFLCAVV